MYTDLCLMFDVFHRDGGEVLPGVVALSLEMFKARLDGALGNLVKPYYVSIDMALWCHAMIHIIIIIISFSLC